MLSKLIKSQKFTQSKNHRLFLGIIGVVCRSQADLNSNKSIEKAFEKERKFFTKKYPSLASRSGTTYLKKRLATLLASHIRDCLPDINMKINILKRQFKV